MSVLIGGRGNQDLLQTKYKVKLYIVYMYLICDTQIQSIADRCDESRFAYVIKHDCQ